MNLPAPNEYAKDHGHNPFPPRWEKWLSAARQAILSAQPKAGRHVSIDEHPGKGTVINVERSRPEAGVTPPGECPTPVILSFDGVIFDCGCTSLNEGNTTSQIVSEGNVNSEQDSMNKGLDSNCLDQPCVWHLGTFNIHTDITVWSDSNDCSTSGGSTTTVINALMVFDGSLYHLFAYSVTGLAAIFYGTTASLSSPITNTLVACSPTYIEFDNPAVTCLFGGPTNLTIVGHDGSATISGF
jgi:hypothetical protein